MASWRDGLRGLFGGGSRTTPKNAVYPPKTSPKTASKDVCTDRSGREKLLKTAMETYKTQRKMGRDALNQALDRLRKRAPSTLHPADLTELMALYQAHVSLKDLLVHRDKRYLVLVGIRQLLGQDGGAPPPAVGALRRVVARR